MAAHEIDQKIQDVYKRMQTERKMLDASKLIRQATTNQEVLRQNDIKIREAERSLSYFEDTLRELQMRKIQLSQPGGSPDSMRSPSTPQPAGLPSNPRTSRPGIPSVPSMGFEGQRGPGSQSPELSTAPGPYPTDDALTSKPKQYSNLDLIRAETPHTPAKITRMLHQLEFKLQVEKQYKAGIDKMSKLYQADGDKKSRADAEAKRVESERKIALLQTALKKYKNLHVLDDVEEEEDASPVVDGQRKDNLRNKPQSGKLQITINGARELEHAPLVNSGKVRSSSKKAMETYVTIKVEGTQHARSHASRTDRWIEDFEIPVDKANEVEIAIYDKQVGEFNPVPIGLLWVRISDLVEAVRRQRVMQETGQGGWVTAGAMGGEGPPGSGGGVYPSSSTGDFNAPLGFPEGPPGGGAPTGGQGEGIDAWFAVEPAGALALQLNFVKENVRKRAVDRPGGLGRQGAVRARKEEVHEMNGHKFVQRQFYQIILCAFCNEFLLNAVGYQCEDCKYTCHKKCYEKVVTKCVSKSNIGDDEEKINHRIPHRFEPLTNMGANWCCHCGQMLPFGRKNARRCSECDITCHASCAHLVPDFCGMSMETANQLLRDWRDINRARGGKPQRPASGTAKHTAPRQSTSSDQQMSQVGGQFDRMRIGTEPPGTDPAYGGRPQQMSPPPPTGLPSDPRQGQPPPLMSHASQAAYNQGPQRPASGARPPVQPGHEAGLPGRPGPGYDGPPDAYPQYDRPPQQPQPPSKPYPGSAAGTPILTQKPLPDRTSSLPSSPAPGHMPLPPQRISQPAPPQPQQPSQPPPPQRQSTRKRKVGLDDFNFLAVLGKGNFGKVMLAEEKKTNSLYAIKVLKKEFIIDNDEVESTRSEKRVFLTAAKERHPFLLGLHSCFQTETRVYFVMEYVSGGDLMLHIQRKQFSLRQAKFYACEVLLALEYFHANGIVYRDLKLDNILLTLDGHVKVADYGLCKEDMYYGSTTSTFCGTPEFMAPEILLEQRYGRAVDWWAFGVLMYEMLLGQSPFRGDDEDEIFDAILEDEPLYPITMPRDAVAILQKLLTRDPNRRLGSGKTDAEEIKRQPFFKDVSWDDVFNKRIPPSYFPSISGTADTSNFDEEFTREQPTLTPVHGQLTARDQAEFNGFSWVAAWADT